MPTGESYRTWKEQIRALRPNQRIMQIENFAWMMVGIYESRSVHLSKVAGKVLGNAKLLSTVRRFERFLNNKAICSTRQIWMNLLVEILPGGLLQLSCLSRIIIRLSSVGKAWIPRQSHSVFRYRTRRVGEFARQNKTQNPIKKYRTGYHDQNPVGNEGANRRLHQKQISASLTCPSSPPSFART